MFQLSAIHAAAELSFHLTDTFDNGDENLDRLEERVNSQLGEVRARRTQVASERGRLWALAESVDRRTRTDAVEYFDDPNYPEDRRVKLAVDLHRFNLLTQAYWRFVRILRPMVEELGVAGRPVRVLELASGSGGFARALAARAAAAGLNVQVRGSDVQPAQVEAANRAAEVAGSPVRFDVLDAFHLDKAPPAQADIVFIAQAVHHFTPGQLARMVRGASRLATRRVVLVDGHRSVFLCGFVPGLALLSGNLDFVHDGFITARRFYSLPELRLIARLATPQYPVDARQDWPSYSVVTVDCGTARGGAPTAESAAPTAPR